MDNDSDSSNDPALAVSTKTKQKAKKQNKTANEGVDKPKAGKTTTNSNTNNAQVTLTQMLKALDPSDASRLESKIKKLSKKKAFKPVLDKTKAEQVDRKLAYEHANKQVAKWDDIVNRRRRAKHLKFPVNEPRNLEPLSAVINDFKPETELEKQVHELVKSNDAVLHDKNELSNAEQKYLKAISADEAKERHIQLQKMRSLISSYGAKMLRQKAIKSKSYRRLLKHERIHRHLRKVESNKDLLMEEVERLQKLRAQERASLKHKNTGKWAKHAKFRSKYDESARRAMIEQISIAEKHLKKPKIVNSDSEDDSDSDGDDSEQDETDSDDDTAKSDDDGKQLIKTRNENNQSQTSELIVSSELLARRSFVRKQTEVDNKNNDDSDRDQSEDGSESDDDEQRRLMSEAFEGDDVVAEFKREKEELANEEQPKDVDTFLPGWGNWTGPGTKTSKKRRSKFVIRAEKVKRRDARLGNVIISEEADGKIKQYMVKARPRGFKSDEQLVQMMNAPISSTFTNQVSHRTAATPRVGVKLGARIEPLNKAILKANKAKWIG